MKYITYLLVVLFMFSGTLFSQEMKVRIKDIGKLIESRDNQLVGYGIVVGLRGTGDSRSVGLTNNALRSFIAKMGVAVGGSDLNARNAASVLVTADLPPFLKPGQRISVTVSALGDAKSLGGGTLIMTPLLGPDMQTYAMAQGVVLVDGINESSSTSTLYKHQSTVGFISDGAIVEEEVAVTFLDQHHITLVINKQSFFTVSNAVQAIQEAGYQGAKAIDGNTIKIPLEDLDSMDLISAISTIENIEITPEPVAKVVVNSKTGTVVIGEKVRLFPVAITHGGMSIRINDDVGGVFGQEGEAIEVIEPKNELVYLQQSDTLTSLVNSLNQLGVSSKDLVSIIQALKESGALVAEVEIL